MHVYIFGLPRTHIAYECKYFRRQGGGLHLKHVCLAFGFRIPRNLNVRPTTLRTELQFGLALLGSNINIMAGLPAR